MEYSRQQIKNHVLATLAYADLFDYPLTKDEVIKWLVKGETFPVKHVQNYVDKANGVIFREDSYLFLEKRAHLTKLRQNRSKEALRKLQEAEKIAKLLSIISTIQLIGISGSLSMNNSQKKDDIDFFIITKGGALWMTRLLSIGLLELLGKRRRPEEKDVTNKICLNMFVDENYLVTPPSQQNLFIAHEICQLKVLYNRNQTYERLIQKNAWIKKYLANALPNIKAHNAYIVNFPLYPLEFLAKFLQLSYMKIRGRVSNMTVTNGRISFYPKDFDVQILKSYKTRLAHYGISI